MKYLITFLICLPLITCEKGQKNDQKNESSAQVATIDIDLLLQKKNLFEFFQSRSYEMLPDSFEVLLGSPKLPDSIRAIVVFNFAKRTYYTGDWKGSIPFFAEARDLLTKSYGETHPELANIYAWWALPYYKMDRCDSMKIMAFKAVELVEQDSMRYPPIIQNTVYNSLGRYYRCSNQYKNMREAHQKAYNKVANLEKQPFGEAPWTLVHLAAAYTLMQDYWTAIEILQKALPGLIKAFAHRKGEGFTATAYDDLGLCYNAVGEYDKAIHYLQKAINNNLTWAKIDSCHSGVAANFKNIATSNVGVGDLARAKIQFETAQKILKNNTYETTVRAGLIRIGLIGVLFKMGRLEEAKKVARSALQIELLTKRKYEVKTTALIHQWLGKIYLHLGQLTRAKKAFSKAENIFQKGESTTQNSLFNHYLEVGKTYIKSFHFEEGLDILLALQKKVKNINFLHKDVLALQIGKAYLNLNNIKAAKNWLDEVGKTTIYQLENPDRLSKQYNAEFLSDYLAIYAQWHTRYYRSQGHIASLDTAILYLEDATNYLFQQRSRLYNTAFLSNTFGPLQEKLIELYELQDALDKNAKIFRQLEQSKAVQLVKSAKANQSQEFFQVPSSISSNIDKLESKINFYYTQVQTLPKQAADFIPQLELVIYELDQLKKQVQQSYPDYYNHRFEHKTISIRAVQDQLGPEEALINYFWGKKMVRAAIITPKEVQIHILGQSHDIHKKIDLLQEGIIQSRKGTANAKYFTEQYIDFALFLFDDLIKPFYPLLNNQFKKLIILPDNIIARLPFNALLTGTPEDIRKKYSYPYLIRDFTISLGYSATFQFDPVLKQKRKKGITYLGFAPYTSTDSIIAEERSTLERNKFQGLPFSKLEVKKGEDIFDGESFIDREALKSVFLKEAENAQILHCATHAMGNDQNGGLSYLLFPSKQDLHTNEFLYAQEIYNLNLQADLVILSACQSSQGTYTQGEGLISLAHAFSAAGARGVCSTYWNLNDKVSYKILTTFFEALKKGQAKNEALRLAQLELLNSSDREAHPYYWAVYHLFGDTEPLSR